jgi:hypothetical protein
MTDVSMNAVAGAIFAAAAGCLTGVVDVRFRTPHGSVFVGALGGMVIAVLAYAMFIAAGMVISLLTFGSAPDVWPALLCVIIGCVVFLLVRTVHSAIAARFGMPERRDSSTPRRLDDLIEAQPRGGPPTMWLGGVGLALLPLAYGISCIVTQRGELGTTIWRSEVQGVAAIALGMGWIGVGLFLHFHFFFGLHSRLSAFSRRGKSIALVVACAGLTIAGAWSVFAQVPG